MQKPTYLDYNSTTPLDPRVLKQMLPYFHEDFGNPANSLHSFGWSAENAVKKAAAQLAELIQCDPSEIVWNSGATEGNNSVIQGLLRQLEKESAPKANSESLPIHIITSRAEHWSVLSPLERASEQKNITVTYLPINKQGCINLDDLKQAITPNTKLISLIWVNNETGAINPIEEVATLCQEKQIYLHSDGTQAVGKISVDLKKIPVHFLTFSAHKFYGPKGVGGLYIRSRNPHVEIEPLIVGGGQQHNRRSGTLNVPGIVGAGAAAELCRQELAQDSEHTRQLLNTFFSQLTAQGLKLEINGPNLTETRSPITLSLVMPQMVDLALPQLSSLAFSQGSACQTSEATGSHVLTALGLSLEKMQRTIRFSIGRFTTLQDIEKAVQVVYKAFKPDITTPDKTLDTF